MGRRQSFLLVRDRPALAADRELRAIPFYSRIGFQDEEAQPLMLTQNAGLPPKIRREHFYGQRWAQNQGALANYGVLGEARLRGWTTRLGLFESVFAPRQEFGDLFERIDANGMAREKVIAFPDSRFASRSGELRASRAFEERERRHAIFFTAKGRMQQRRYGGEDVIDAGVVELGVGVQKTFYSKTVETPTGKLPKSRAQPVLVNATATWYAADRLALYGSYTEGLEESPVAPDNAVNRNGAAPAINTEQYDAGLRWTVTGNLKLIAGVFNIEKPYFDLDANAVFTSLRLASTMSVLPTVVKVVAVLKLCGLAYLVYHVGSRSLLSWSRLAWVAACWVATVAAAFGSARWLVPENAVSNLTAICSVIVIAPVLGIIAAPLALQFNRCR